MTPLYLRNWRIRHMLNKADMARLTGYHYTHYWRIEEGECPVPPLLDLAICMMNECLPDENARRAMLFRWLNKPATPNKLIDMHCKSV